MGINGPVTGLGRMVERGGRLICALRGHDSVLHFERDSVMMRCTSCGYQSPGWQVTGRAPRKCHDGDAARHRLVMPEVLRKTA